MRKPAISSLNPCFNGRCTRTRVDLAVGIIDDVLILVLMEDALVRIMLIPTSLSVLSLNPCFNGRCTRT